MNPLILAYSCDAIGLLLLAVVIVSLIRRQHQPIASTQPQPVTMPDTPVLLNLAARNMSRAVRLDYEYGPNSNTVHLAQIAAGYLTAKEGQPWNR
jgi:hypothetical protein